MSAFDLSMLSAESIMNRCVGFNCNPSTWEIKNWASLSVLRKSEMYNALRAT